VIESYEENKLFVPYDAAFSDDGATYLFSTEAWNVGPWDAAVPPRLVFRWKKIADLWYSDPQPSQAFR